MALQIRHCAFKISGLPAVAQRVSVRVATISLIFGMGISVSGCTAYSNSRLCKQKMEATYPTTSPKLSYSFPRSSYGGTHTVAEATYRQHKVTFVTDPQDSSIPGKLVEEDAEMSAAVECTFDGDKMTTFRWIAPESFAAVYNDVPDINGEVPKVQGAHESDEPTAVGK